MPINLESETVNSVQMLLNELGFDGRATVEPLTPWPAKSCQRGWIQDECFGAVSA